MYFEHLKELEAESINIIWEVYQYFKKPAMLYSVGKDSSVLLHLMKKAFAPSKIPFPLVHVDTLWKFKDMISFRNQKAKTDNFDLIVYTNERGRKLNINPFIHGSEKHTDIMKTQALKQMLDKYKFDAIFGGARRDEEKSRAKERVFSFRDKNHRWNPKNQRPELWNIYNHKLNPQESIRAFPLSNWTELDIWLYIYQENIDIVPLYFAKKRKIIEYNSALILIDDDRMPKELREKTKEEMIRFRTLGCYPLTGGIRSNAETVYDIIIELMLSKTSERQSRVIDYDENSSMEKKKKEGYF